MNVADLAATLKLTPDEASFAHGEQLLESIAHTLEEVAKVVTLKLDPEKEGFNLAKTLIEGVKSAFEELVSLETVSKLGELVKSTVELGTKLNETAQKTGLSVEALQRLGFVAQLSSSSTDAFAKGIQKLATGLSDTGDKASGPAAALAKLGITMTDAAFQGATLEDKVGLIAEKLAALPDGGAKTALALQLFGEAGADLIPTLNELGKHGDELRTQFEDMGGGLSGEQAEQLEQFGKGLDRVKIQFGMLKDAMVAEVLPVLQELLTGLLGWIQANRELISSSLQGVMQGLSSVLRVLGTAFNGVLEVFQFFLEHATLAQSILIALGLVIAAFAIEAAAAWLIAFWPVALVIAAITAIILLVRTLITHADDIKQAFVDAWDWIARQANEFWEGLKAIGEAIADFFVGVAGSIKQAFVDAFNWIVDKAQAVVNQLADMPVVKQLVEFGHWVGPGTGDEAIDTMIRADSKLADGLSHGSTVTFGDTHVSIHVDSVSGDPQEVATKIQQAIAEHHDARMREAHAATGGADLGSQ